MTTAGLIGGAILGSALFVYLLLGLAILTSTRSYSSVPKWCKPAEVMLYGIAGFLACIAVSLIGRFLYEAFSLIF